MFKFTINGNIWRVKEKDKKTLLEKYNDGHENEAYFVFGLTSYPNHEIWINEEMCMSQKINTLKHELTHCYIWNYGLYNVPHFTEEMLCDIVSNIDKFINAIVNQYKEVINQNKENEEMTIQELFKNHVEQKCKNCTLENCKGITITLDNKTRCEKMEELENGR